MRLSASSTSRPASIRLQNRITVVVANPASPAQSTTSSTQAIGRGARARQGDSHLREQSPSCAALTCSSVSRSPRPP